MRPSRQLLIVIIVFAACYMHANYPGLIGSRLDLPKFTSAAVAIAFLAVVLVAAVIKRWKNMHGMRGGGHISDGEKLMRMNAARLELQHRFEQCKSRKQARGGGGAAL